MSGSRARHRRTPKTKDLMEAVSAFYKRERKPQPLKMTNAPRITRFGTVIVSRQGVQLRDFSTENAPTPRDLSKTVIDWAIERLLEARTFFAPPRHGIEKYIDAIQHSIRTRNWFGAFFLALAMPDICGALEHPRKACKSRYIEWFDKYLGPHHVPELFSGEDCYYLRCKALHEGLADHPNAKSERMVIVTATPGMQFHCNFMEGPEEGTFKLQMQIDVFCEEICDGVSRWLQAVQNNSGVLSRIEELLEFQDPSKPLKW